MLIHKNGEIGSLIKNIFSIKQLKKFYQNSIYEYFDTSTDPFFKKPKILPDLSSYKKEFSFKIDVQEDSIHLGLLRYLNKIYQNQRPCENKKIVQIEERDKNTIICDVLDIYKIHFLKSFLNQIELLFTISKKNKLKIFVDGGCSGILKTGSYGSVLYINDKRSLLIFGNIGNESTNNTAEYFALNMILLLLNLIPDKKISQMQIFADSQLLTRQMNREYNIKSPHIFILNAVANNLITKINSEKIEINHLMREYNTEADHLAGLGKSLESNKFKIYF